MTKVAIIGMQYGDEGKGKMVDLLAPAFRVVARYGGADNAGHTVCCGGKVYRLHLIPSGITHPNTYNALLSGVLTDPLALMDEIKCVRDLGCRIEHENFGVSGLTHQTMLYHKEFEKESELRKGAKAVGTTLKGVGPTAISKVAREGIRFAEFLNPEFFEHYLKSLVGNRGNIVARLNSEEDVKRYLEMYRGAQEFLRPFLIQDDILYEKFKDAAWLYEGAQGFWLDVDKGTYPYVTSTNPASPPTDADEVHGIFKAAYSTRVGNGPFVTKMDSETANRIRGNKDEVDAEFGATTGRPRDCGWRDLVADRFARHVSGISMMHLTKMDKTDGLPEIKFCIAYYYKGSLLKEFPLERNVLEQVKPVYKTMKGWETTKNAREKNDLPQTAVDFFHLLEDELECPIGLVSNGTTAEQTIVFNKKMGFVENLKKTF